MRILLLLFIMIFSGIASGQKQLLFDSSIIQSRPFSDNALEKFRKDKDFQYEHFYRPRLNLWQRFWSWFWGKVYEITATKKGRRTVNVIFIVLAVAVIGFFIYKVTDMNKEHLFERSSRDGLNYSVSTDDINSISFDEAIEEAVSSGNYRMAVRLLYLKSLKTLSDKGFIEWQINKTNSDYLKEVSGNRWYHLFSTLTYNFDYIWYGEAQVSKERFIEVKQQFTAFNNQL